MRDCPICTMTVPCDTDGCVEPARYGTVLSCGCTVLHCVRDANRFAAARATTGEVVCPVCAELVAHEHTVDVTGAAHA